MLTHVLIRDLVLIEQVELSLAAGLAVLTGETGAGKSILLDGLGLALGGRADSGLVRAGCAQASVSAEFHLPPDHDVHALLAAQDLPPAEDGVLILRRTVKADGGSRAHVQDQPVSAATLRALGALLVEVHGQHDERGLLNPRGHLALLDLFGNHGALLEAMRRAHAHWRDAAEALETHRARAAADAADREWLDHAVSEIAALHPVAGEEAELADTRARIKRGEALESSMTDVERLVSAADGALSQLRQAARRLERIADDDKALAEALEAVDRALVEGDGIEQALATARSRLDLSPEALEAAESRLFDLRALARKHRVEVDALPALLAELQARQQAVDDAGAAGEALERQVAAAHKVMLAAASTLHEARVQAAAALDRAVNAELPALKLDSARFRTPVVAVEPGPTGADRVTFEIATNAATGFGPLTRIASGGELSRFMLALKVALARSGVAGTLIFDEIDRGVGGATASAIGERLARVATQSQVLVVTHSPQVAAAGSRHFRISKATGQTQVSLLSADERLEEIARMLSGTHITPEARAQAARLLAGTE